MKKYISLIIIALAMVSCSTTRDSAPHYVAIPAMMVVKDGKVTLKRNGITQPLKDTTAQVYLIQKRQ